MEVTTVALGLALLVSCSGFKVTPVPPSGSFCPALCNKLDALACPGWYKTPGVDELYNTPDDQSCGFICPIMAQDVTFKPPIKCILAARNCVELDKCYL